MASNSVGQIRLDLVVNQNQFKKQMSGIQILAKKAGTALKSAFDVKKLIAFGKSCIELGSNLTEVQNVVDVTFPHMTAQVDQFAKGAATSFGLSETMAKQFIGTFGSMAKGFGFSEQAAYDMGSTLTGLAGDVASFYNISQDEAFTKLKSVFTGETESLKDLGVVMTQSALDAFAMANGFGKVTANMSEAEKVALRYAFVQDKLAAAQGDFARTSDSWANQTRILKLQFDSLKATLGQGLINVLTPVLKVINSLMSKLMSLASAFKSFTELITGNKSKGGSGFQDTATDLTSAAGAANSLAGSTEGVGKAAKKAAKDMKSLMGFDQINKVQEPSSESDSGGGSGASGGGTGVGGDFGSLAEGETVLDELDAKFVKLFENIKNNVQPTVDSLKRLWNEGLAKLGDFAWTALKDFYNGFLVPVAKWTFGEGIPRFIDALNNGLMAVDWGRINEALRELWDALTPFAINVGEGLLWFWENVLVPYGTWVVNEGVPRFLKLLATAIEALNNIIEALKPLFKWFWDNVLLPIASWTGGIFLQVYDGIIDALKRFSDWCGNNPAIIETIAVVVGAFFAAWKIVDLATTIGGIITALLSFVTTGGLAATVSTLLGGAITLLTSPITIAVLAIGSLIAIGVLLWKNWDTVSAKAKEVWAFVQEKFQAFSNFLKNVFSKDWSKSFGAFGDILNAFFKNVSNIWNSIKKIFGGIVDFISGVFTGNWKKAWNGVKDIFKGIWDLLVSVIKAPINAIIGAINGLVSGVASGINLVTGALNNLSFDVPDWVPLIGGKTFGFNIPKLSPSKIPYLAQGGFVRANTPQLAMIGDNRHYGEVVAPENKLQEMVDTAVRMASGSGGITRAELESIINNAVLRLISALSSMGFYVDGEEMAKAMLKATDRLDGRFNPVKIY